MDRAPLALQKIENEYLLFGAAGLVSLVAFVALIFVPAIELLRADLGEGRGRVLSLFVLAALVLMGVVVGLAIVYYYNDIVEVVWLNWFGIMALMPCQPPKGRKALQEQEIRDPRRALRGGRVGRRAARRGARRGAGARRQRRADRALGGGAGGRRRLAGPGGEAAGRWGAGDFGRAAGRRRRRRRAAIPGEGAARPAIARMVTTLLALELERSRSPDWQNEEVAGVFVARGAAPAR